MVSLLLFLKGYSLNMIDVMKEIESTLISQDLTSASINKYMTVAPAKLKVASCSNKTELAAILASLNEIIVEERVGVLICSTHTLQEDKRIMELAYNRLYELTKLSPVIVMYSYVQLADLPAPKFFKKPTASIEWSGAKPALVPKDRTDKVSSII